MGEIKTAGHHPAVAGVLRFFEYGHLPEGFIRDRSTQFAVFAEELAENLPSDPELTVALRKLLEAKDAAVRCAVIGEKARRGMDQGETIVNPSEFAADTQTHGLTP